MLEKNLVKKKNKYQEKKLFNYEIPNMLKA